MMVRLTRKMVKPYGKDFPMGKVITVIPSVGRELIAVGKAVLYTDGKPVKKVKTDFFKPKE